MTDETNFNDLAENLQRQAESLHSIAYKTWTNISSWILASLLVLNSAALATIQTDIESNDYLSQIAGLLFIAGIVLAVIAGLRMALELARLGNHALNIASMNKSELIRKLSESNGIMQTISELDAPLIWPQRLGIFSLVSFTIGCFAFQISS